MEQAPIARPGLEYYASQGAKYGLILALIYGFCAGLVGSLIFTIQMASREDGFPRLIESLPEITFYAIAVAISFAFPISLTVAPFIGMLTSLILLWMMRVLTPRTSLQTATFYSGMLCCGVVALVHLIIFVLYADEAWYLDPMSYIFLLGAPSFVFLTWGVWWGRRTYHQMNGVTTSP